MPTQNNRTCPECGGTIANHYAKTCRACWRRYRPPIANGNGTHTVVLTRGAVAIIDSADLPLVTGFNWRLGKNGYAVRSITGGRAVYLHRVILGAVDGDIVDHKNQNKLDCRRGNLRLASCQSNMANVTARSTTTGPFKGVSLRCDGKRWTARVQFNGKGIHLGSFDTPEAAARAYDAKATELFGEFAGVNFPDGGIEAA